MTEEPQNLTLQVVREMREEMRKGFKAMDDRFNSLADEVTELKIMTNASVELLGVHTNRMTTLEKRIAHIERRLELTDAPQEH